MMNRLTAAHVTHEACEKIGGIGTVLEGILTSPVYQAQVKRSILIGPFANHMESAPDQRLGPDGTVLYSTIDKIDDADLGGKLRPIEWAFNVAFIYGTRRFELPGSPDHTGIAEILLIDVFNANQQHVNVFKKRLHELLGLDSIRYESDWGFEEYMRLAEPAYYALQALLRHDELPCVLFSHEFMGLPTAFKCVLDGQKQFRTIFHAHECGTARRIVENHPGHDTAFYNVMREASKQGLYVNDVFGDQSDSFRHALVSRAHMCDAIFAVGDMTAQEMHFLGRHFDHHHIDLVYNGVPPLKVTHQAEIDSRRMLIEYAEAVIGDGFEPDVLMTHVTRPVVSKGIWRDLQVCHELDARFAAEKRRGALFILTTAGGTRRPQDVRSMEAEYGWPRSHREGYPDLCGPEVDINRMVEQFNATHRHIQAVLVNQFDWREDLIGSKCPPGMTFADLRRATDVEFGLATYEPFGISPLEPLGSGAICVISEACGCGGFVRQVTNGRTVPNVIIADYTKLDRGGMGASLDELKRIGVAEREAVERKVAAEVADQLMRTLPRNDAERKSMLDAGQKLVKQMGWDQILEHNMMPTLRRVMSTGNTRETNKRELVST